MTKQEALQFIEEKLGELTDPRYIRISFRNEGWDTRRAIFLNVDSRTTDTEVVSKEELFEWLAIQTDIRRIWIYVDEEATPDHWTEDGNGIKRAYTELQ